MLTINEIKKEAIKFRELIEKCDKDNTCLVIDSFPVMSCKLSSMLLSYHFLTLWPELELRGVSATTGKNSQISHYWLEINDFVIDITGDQYNLIDDIELNKKIIQSRPFPAVHVSHIKESYLYKLFKIREKECLACGFPTIRECFIEEMERGYSQLLNQENG
ncbi:hypothetical protein NFB71_04235 [Yersinia ruckeri]|uniref:hypothetical protein n=1 Tax=Yersinia ruckeri TaxID=29486 RepID=UPI001F188F10|nr:hypothetical protein [Yersinia ruckeri]EKN4705331.1 hypothetical protein [Yersinia ruckeri]MCW6593268.1 hypothetical protein [Yersinia ruckeri]UIN00117.1 hypothetical protein LGL91_13380 [Yersinia ruckeri]UIN08124.1 hypothetical protein LGL88_03900 [Yersinia ruckeri]UIN13358.1 hypothetical protein LGL85_13440 [Yersinia ruckeri]